MVNIANQIEKYLPIVVKIFKKLKYLNFKIKEKVNHIDLHPHNIITKNKIVAFWTSNLCKTINDGYSIAYNLLKLCKQFVLYNKR